MLVAVTECNKNWKVVRRPGNGDLEFKSARVCSYLRVSEGVWGVGGLGLRSFALGPWSPVWGVGLGGSWSFALRVGVGVPKRGWWRPKRVCWRGVRGGRGVGLRLVCPKRARGRVGRGYRPMCPSAAVGPGVACAGRGRTRDVLVCTWSWCGVDATCLVHPLRSGGQGLDRFTLDVL